MQQYRKKPKTRLNHSQRWDSLFQSHDKRNSRLHLDSNFFLQNKFNCFILPCKGRWRVPWQRRRWRRAPLHWMVKPIGKVGHWQFYWFWVALRGMRNLEPQEKWKWKIEQMLDKGEANSKKLLINKMLKFISTYSELILKCFNQDLN